MDHIHLDLHGPWHCGNKKFYIWGATCPFFKYLKKASSAFRFLMNKVVFLAVFFTGSDAPCSEPVKPPLQEQPKFPSVVQGSETEGSPKARSDRPDSP